MANGNSTKSPMSIETLGASPCGSVVWQLATGSTKTLPMLRAVDLSHAKNNPEVRSVYWGANFTRKGLFGIISSIIRPNIWDDARTREAVFTPWFIDLVARIDASPSRDWNGAGSNASASEREAIQRAERAEAALVELRREQEEMRRQLAMMQGQRAPTATTAPAPTATTAPAPAPAAPAPADSDALTLLGKLMTR